MTPFITKYAASQALINRRLGSIEYSPSVESSVVAGTCCPVINVEEVAIELSGSTVTQAQVDPTNDESTDR